MSLGVSYRDEIALEEADKPSICSCPRCDSYNCFEIQNHSTFRCHCDKCEQPKTCLYYNECTPKCASFMSDIAHTEQVNTQQEKERETEKLMSRLNYTNEVLNIQSDSLCQGLTPCMDTIKAFSKKDAEEDLKEKNIVKTKNSIEKRPLRLDSNSRGRVRIQYESDIKEEERHLNSQRDMKEHLKRDLFNECNANETINNTSKNNLTRKNNDEYLISKSSKKLMPCHCKPDMQLDKTLRDEKKEKNETKDCFCFMGSMEEKLKNADSKINLNTNDSLYDGLKVPSKCNLFLDKNKRVIVCASAPFAGTSAAKLTAEVMNVPYKEYEKSISYSKTIPEKVINNDIFQKIRDIYNACSCKVCECIASLSVKDIKDEKCNCKPCDCADCRHFKTNRNDLIKSVLGEKDLFENNVTSKIRSVPETAPCDCKPCACIQCRNVEETFRGTCNCKPCGCIQCKLGITKRSNFIVAPVEEHQTCQCSPCSCFECIHNFGPGPRQRATQEMGTDVYRHTNCHCHPCRSANCEQEGPNSCNCDRQSKALRKPVLRDNNQYDIHNVEVKNTPIFFQKYTRNLKKIEDTMVMSVSVPKRGYNCQPYWSTRSNRSEPVHFVEVKTSKDYLNRPFISKSCNCKPCDCTKCKKHYTEGHIPSQRFQDRSCEICNYINREYLEKSLCHCNVKEQKRLVHGKNSNCSCSEYSLLPAEYDSVKSSMLPNQNNCNIQQHPSKTTKYMNSNHYPTILTPYEDDFFIESVLTESSKKHEVANVEDYMTPVKESVNIAAKLPNEQPHTMNQCSPEINVNTLSRYGKANSKVYDMFSCDKKKKTITGTSKIDAEIQCAEKFNCKCDANVQWTDDDSSESLHSSTSGPYGNLPDSHRTKKRDIKSRNSSCNSSGHDYSDYLVKFPRSTVETCIKDVINMDNHQQCDITCLKTSIAHNINRYANSIKSRNNNCLLKVKRKPLGCHNVLNNGRISYIKTCKNYTYNDSCECGQCDCESCTYKVFKSHRCHCDCAVCDCSGTCLSEDRSVFIRKNENTQTMILDPDKSKIKQRTSMSRQSETTDLVNDMYRTWETNNLENIKYYNRDTQVNCNTESLNNSSCLINANEVICKISPNVIPFRYKSVEDTIKDAKQFSAELARILESYENANKNFSSEAKRFEVIHESIVNGKIYENKPKKTDKDNNDKKSMEINLKNQEDTAICGLHNVEITFNSREATTICSEEHNRDSSSTIGDDNKYHPNNIQCIVTQRNNDEIEEIDTTQVLNKTIDTGLVLDTNTKIQDAKIVVDGATYPLFSIPPNIMNKRLGDISTIDIKTVIEGGILPIISVKADYYDEVNTKYEFGETKIPESSSIDVKEKGLKEIQSLEPKPNLKFIESEYNKYSKLINEAILKCGQKMEKKETKSVTNYKPKDSKSNADSICLSRQLPRQTEKPNEHPKLILKMRHAVHATSRNAFENKNDFVVCSCTPEETNIIKSTTEENCGELKKINVKKNDSDIKESENPKINPSKAFYDLINNSQETVYSTRRHRKQFKLTDSFIEMRHQIESMPVITARKLVVNPSENVLSTSSKTKERDERKLSFDSVRKVSDHTLIVKWKKPDIITDVKGFELLIDGKSVQKVSPSRNMAVVTCLPHSDRLLLTVRTIPSNASSGIASTSFVYRPRASNFRKPM